MLQGSLAWEEQGAEVPGEASQVGALGHLGEQHVSRHRQEKQAVCVCVGGVCRGHLAAPLPLLLCLLIGSGKIWVFGS